MGIYGLSGYRALTDSQDQEIRRQVDNDPSPPERWMGPTLGKKDKRIQ